MPRRRRAHPSALPEVAPELLDGMVVGVQTSADLDARLEQLAAAPSERSLAAELTQHMQFPPGADWPPGTASARNGTPP
jgi:hypothetical protein